MSEIGVFEAMAELPLLLERVQAGESFVITRRERPVVELIPCRGADTEQFRTAIENLKELRESHRLGGGLSIHELIEEGRRYQ